MVAGAAVRYHRPAMRKQLRSPWYIRPHAVINSAEGHRQVRRSPAATIAPATRTAASCQVVRTAIDPTSGRLARLIRSGSGPTKDAILLVLTSVFGYA